MDLKFLKASQIPEFSRLKLGCPHIDMILKGGFQTYWLYEIVGCSGSGKTQICMVLSLMVQISKGLGGLNGAAVYICTENVFPIKRLYELAQWFEMKYEIENVLDNIFINHVPDFERLANVLDIQIPKLATFKNVGLIIIDSIAGLYRSCNIDISYRNRSKELNLISSKLRKLGAKLNCVIISCNQIADNIATGESEPCLGLSWSNLINCRIFLKRSSSNRRSFEIAFAPDSQTAKVEFYISDKGLHSLPG